MGGMAYNRYTNIFKGSHEGNWIDCLSTNDNLNFSPKSESFHPLLRYTYRIYCLLNMLTRLFTWNLTSSCLYTRRDKVHEGNRTFVLLVSHSLVYPRKLWNIIRRSIVLQFNRNISFSASSSSTYSMCCHCSWGDKGLYYGCNGKNGPLYNWNLFGWTEPAIKYFTLHFIFAMNTYSINVDRRTGWVEDTTQYYV